MPQRRHRYHYSLHDASPHFGMLNVMIGLAVMICLWNVWTAPPPTVVTTTTQGLAAVGQYSDLVASSLDSNSQQLKQPSQQAQLESLSRTVNQPEQLSSSQANATPTLALSITLLPSSSPEEKIQDNNIRLYPVHTGPNGQKFILLAPLRKRQESRPRTALEPGNEFGQEIDASKTPKEEQASGATPTRNTIPNKNKNKQVPSNRRGLSTPLFVDTVTYEPLSSSSSSSSSSSTYARHHYRPKWSSWMYGFAISASVLAGGLFAKRALKRMDRWEQLSKEDSLAFDVAYTSPYQDDVHSYGSFAATSDWSGDFLDRFDV